MRLSKYLVGTLACALMAACSNEENPAVDNGTQGQEGEAYMTVQFAMAGDATSRALGGFDYATDDEIAVTKATFFFLDASYNGCADPYTLTASEDWTWTNNEANPDGSVNTTSSPVIVVRNAISLPKYIVAILNPTDTYTDRFSLSQLEAITGDYETNCQTKGNFVMSNSVYKNGTSKVIAAEVTENNIKETEAEALADNAPVVINVERVLAKVAVDNNSQSGNESIDIDGTASTVTVVLDGFWLDNTNPNSYLIKDMDATWNGTVNSTDAWWNDPSNSRSYWAKSYTPATGESYGHGSYSANDQNDKYCQENTDASNHTQVVVAATLKVNNDEVSLVSYRGLYYTKNNFLTEIANMIPSMATPYYVRTNEGTEPAEYSTLRAQDLDLTFNTSTGDITIDGSPIEDYEAVPTLASTVTAVYTRSGNEGPYTPVSDLSTVRTALNNLVDPVKYWKDGQTYFYFPIEHNTGSSNPDGSYGVVRNHLYNITISGVNGLGTPVPNPDIDIVPVTPPDDEQSYIAAKINILSYKVVTNSVTLGGGSSSSETTGDGGE